LKASNQICKSPWQAAIFKKISPLCFSNFLTHRIFLEKSNNHFSKKITRFVFNLAFSFFEKNNRFSKNFLAPRIFKIQN